MKKVNGSLVFRSKRIDEESTGTKDEAREERERDDEVRVYRINKRCDREGRKAEVLYREGDQ